MEGHQGGHRRLRRYGIPAIKLIPAAISPGGNVAMVVADTRGSDTMRNVRYMDRPCRLHEDAARPLAQYTRDESPDSPPFPLDHLLYLCYRLLSRLDPLLVIRGMLECLETPKTPLCFPIQLATSLVRIGQLYGTYLASASTACIPSRPHGPYSPPPLVYTTAMPSFSIIIGRG